MARVPSLIVHGGAGADPKDGPHELRDGIRAAVEVGWRILSDGGRALDAVENAVRALEDHPRFNAGRGSVLTSAGTVEMDASIMDGDRLDCGAVGAITRLGNPISVARRVLDDGRHVLLVGDGAQAFARAAGFVECAAEDLITERQRRRRDGDPSIATDVGARGTVGAVAVDRHGASAAATSTGGTWGKRPGRVGDSALIGCGTYADSTLGAVSCTGDGEAIMRVVLARRTLDFLKDAGDPEYAAHVAVDLLMDEGRGGGGLIVVDWRGRTAWAHSTPFMPVGWMNPSCGAPRIPF
jgi:beta-aspartyl-peptidase (threonine type)